MEREELAAWLRLALTEGVGNTAARRLLAAFGLPQDILAAASDALEQVVSPAQARALLDIPPGFDEQLQLTWDWLAPMALDSSSWVMSNFLMRRAANAMAVSGTDLGMCVRVH